MPPWLTDTTVIVSLVTVCGGLIGTLITTLAGRKDRETKIQFAEIMDNLNALTSKVETIDETTVENRAIALKTQDGTKKIQRYRLFHDLQIEIMKGYTTIERYRELSILFESYKDLGGNGEIEALYRKYMDLPIKEEEDEIKQSTV